MRFHAIFAVFERQLKIRLIIIVACVTGPRLRFVKAYTREAVTHLTAYKLIISFSRSRHHLNYLCHRLSLVPVL